MDGGDDERDGLTSGRGNESRQDWCYITCSHAVCSESGADLLTRGTGVAELQNISLCAQRSSAFYSSILHWRFPLFNLIDLEHSVSRRS